MHIYILYALYMCMYVCACVQAEILREADAMSSLNHPYIVKLYGESVRGKGCWVWSTRSEW